MSETADCKHHRYKKEQAEQKWTGHTTVWILAQRTCLDCGYSREDWEFGDHECHPRMFPDEVNFFAGEDMLEEKEAVHQLA
ncbi:MAG: hypothetical protein COT92_00105 [Candidatus Doudnabacteria bacterium CG10_big_fil_rev_8_21_14_0_10_42_18]|uniref:Uncharacterized protein n=1 Tax=Candidatus Doudnabacteria bacterium CG10_big_fil_rev_8_21_14_0_10_42_18 TaxID=1974552 RepID=A0A2H0VC23_9BACT|nr:MAG: hypothetical protein COT92_00105 [Candidatus Doudnabacteria bacterium CG10_big_fil_rev_8_21_14_0_10_42_18]